MIIAKVYYESWNVLYIAATPSLSLLAQRLFGISVIMSRHIKSKSQQAI